MKQFVLALLLASSIVVCAPSHAALSSNNPSFQIYFDDLLDTDEPTGLTKSNPGASTDPTVAGAGDTYIDCNGTDDAIMFTTATPPGEVGTGPVTLVIKAQRDTTTNGSFIADFYDGSGTATTNSGYQVTNTSGTSLRVGLNAPPIASATARIDTPSNTIVQSQPFIIALRRDVTGEPWSVWLDIDLTDGTGMVDVTGGVGATNNIADATGFTELGDFAFCSTRAGATFFDGRVYWATLFESIVSDADLALVDWNNEANLKTAWLGAGGSSSAAVLSFHRQQMTKH